MINVSNPTCAEIEEWAYNSESYPTEDWDIEVFDQISKVERNELVLKIASDTNCPKQDEFLRFLNRMTGSVVRPATKKGFNKKNLSILQDLIEKASESHVDEVVKWSLKSKAVIEDITLYRYEDWYH